MTERRRLCLLFLLFVLLYGFFFQGGGGNQNTRFDTIRALVERHSFDISGLAKNTPDKALYGGKVFSNKAPGFSMLGAPAYALLHALDPQNPDDFYRINRCVHLLTVLLAGMPGAGLVLLLLWLLRRHGTEPRRATWLAVAFGLGSLNLPYGTIFMSHELTAFLLLLSWALASDRSAAPRGLLLAGIAGGLAVLTEYLVGPLVVLIWLDLIRRRHSERAILLSFLPGCLLALAILAANNLLCFDSVLVTNYSFQRAAFRTQGAVMGVFLAPEPARLWWLSFHPLRGIFACSPLYLLPAAGLLAWSAGRGGNQLPAFPALVVLYFAAFGLCFNSWTGGWGVGPRYLLPGLAFLFLYAGALSFPWWLESALAAVSAAFMLAVTSVAVMLPAPDFGPPQHPYPYEIVGRALSDGLVSVSSVSVAGPAFDLPGSTTGPWASYNLGEVCGLNGLWSLAPALVLVLAILALVSSRPAEPQEPEPKAPSEGLESSSSSSNAARDGS